MDGYPAEISSLEQISELLPRLQSDLAASMDAIGLTEADMLEYLKARPDMASGADQIVSMGGIEGVLNEVNKVNTQLLAEQAQRQAIIAKAGGVDALQAQTDQEIAGKEAQIAAKKAEIAALKNPPADTAPATAQTTTTAAETTTAETPATTTTTETTASASSVAAVAPAVAAVARMPAPAMAAPAVAAQAPAGAQVAATEINREWVIQRYKDLKV